MKIDAGSSARNIIPDVGYNLQFEVFEKPEVLDATSCGTATEVPEEVREEVRVCFVEAACKYASVNPEWWKVKRA